MGMITQQPNGLYARISGVVDAPTHENMTKDDLNQYLIDTYQFDEVTPDVDSFLNEYGWSFEEACKRITDLNMTEKEKQDWIDKVSRKEE